MFASSRTGNQSVQNVLTTIRDEKTHLEKAGYTCSIGYDDSDTKFKGYINCTKYMLWSNPIAYSHQISVDVPTGILLSEKVKITT